MLVQVEERMAVPAHVLLNRFAHQAGAGHLADRACLFRDLRRSAPGFPVQLVADPGVLQLFGVL